MSKPIVLLIDDEEAYAKIIKETMESMGMDVLLASNAMEAMFFLQQGNPHLILLDVMMPEVDGLTLLKWLRSNSSGYHVPVIIVSAKALPEDRSAALQGGADSFLAKPFTMQDLKDILAEHLQLTDSPRM